MLKRQKTSTLDKIKSGSLDAANFLKLFSDKSRLLILCCLNEKEKTVSDLEKELDISQSSVSQKLGKLKDQGIVSSQRVGKNVFYKIKDPKVMVLIKTLYNLFCGAEE